MTSNDQLFQLVRSLSEKVDNNHREVIAELKDHRQSTDEKLEKTDLRIDELKMVVDKHAHHFKLMSTFTAWVIPSGGALIAFWTWLTGSNPHK